jgi:hypothetical protein
MAGKVYFSAGQVLEGKVDVATLEAGFVWVRIDRGGYPRLARALEYMGKFGWRVVGYSYGGIVMLQKGE